jgi:mono/diheme cytochrome c family protein
MMLSRTFRILLAAAAFMAVGLATQQSAFAEPFYQGPKKCQECHGDEFKVWEGTKHFTSLKTAHKSKKVKPKPITKAVGGNKRMKKNKTCTLCHYTMVQKDAGAKAKAKAGPSCESCHGASSDWFDIHNDYGGPAVKRDEEAPEHKGMVWSFMRYGIAKNCVSCHGMAREGIDGDVLSKMLAAGHPLNHEFELVRYSQGSVRHRFYPPNVTVNAELSQAGLAEVFVQGQAAKLVSAVGALSGSGDSEYKAAQEKRKADAETALAAVKSVAEAAALVADPTEANAQALVDAIAGKDLSGEVGGLLPDPATYK